MKQCLLLACLLPLVGCATYSSSSLTLKAAEKQGELADQVYQISWKNTGLSDAQRTVWVDLWQIQNADLQNQLHTARMACDSGKSLAWNLVRRQRQLNRCQEYSTVLERRAQALQSWAMLSASLAVNGSSDLWKQGPFELSWKVPSTCDSLALWMPKVPTALRFDSLSTKDRLGSDSRLLLLNADSQNWLERWNWVRSSCLSENRPDPKWFWIQSQAWNWWALSAQAALMQIQGESEQKRMDSLRALSASEVENSLKSSTQLAQCEEALKAKDQSILQVKLDQKSALESCQEGKKNTKAQLDQCQNPNEALRYLSQSAFHIAAQDQDQKIIRLEVADSSFEGAEPKEQLKMNLARLAGIWSRSDRPILVLGCDGYSDLGRKAEKIRADLLLLGLDEIQCLSTQSSSQVPRFEIVVQKRN